MADTGPADAPPNSTDLAVQVHSAVVAFGGLLALDGVDLAAVPGERLAIIGPNGAGKTTLFNAIAGDVTLTRGSIVIKGVDCTYLPSRRRPKLGVARTYQKARTLDGLTVVDNIYLALAGHGGRHRVPWRSAVDRRIRARAEEVAESVWLAERRGALAGALAHGQKRQLELGMAIATEPDVLLLDEPASGLSRGERERLVELLEALPGTVTVLLIEHDMEVAFRVAQRVVVMADGATVAVGPPAEIQNDSTVHEIYLGTEAVRAGEVDRT